MTMNWDAIVGGIAPAVAIGPCIGIVAGAAWLISKIPEWFPSLRC